MPVKQGHKPTENGGKIAGNICKEEMQDSFPLLIEIQTELNLD